MSAYVDTNVLVRLYLKSQASAEARELLTGPAARQTWPFPITTLLRFELANALQRMIYEFGNSGPWRATPAGVALASADFAEHLSAGTFLRAVPLALEDLEAQFGDLVARHTARNGFRTYDILHVASALHLGCDTFWSFDAKARKLAKLEGLKTNR